jgi:GT2 family glycosyltransferase
MISDPYLWSDHLESANVVAVVVTYNGEAWISACIEHLLASGRPLTKIVVVDNASSDSTVEICSKFDRITLVRNRANLGFGKANNLGISWALKNGATHVLLVNQDACVEPQMLELLLRHAGPHVGIVTPMQWDAVGAQLDATFLRYYLAEFAGALVSDAVAGRLGSVYEVESTPAALWLCSSEMLQAVGGFDPLFFMYCEDDDLCRRVRRGGFKVVVVPEARFRHARGFHASASSAPWRSRLNRKVVRNRSVFLYPVLDPTRSLPVTLWRSASSILLQGLQQLIQHADWVAFGASVLAVAGGMCHIRKLREHRTLAVTRGPHWLV